MHGLEPADPPALGGYPLLARLGAGGMGQVYLSRTASGRPLALKTVRSDLGAELGFEARFDREIRNSDRVRSPWSVAVVDHSAAGQRPQWLATEYVPAPSLGEWVEQHGPLPEPALLALAAELCGALQAVHATGLAHRDVKPGNVLLAGDHPRLIDFGIARAADDSRHTHTGGMIGSPGFLAPEQATGTGTAAPVDVFSLAAVLAHAATGHGPFTRPEENASAPVLLYRIVHEDPDLGGVPEALRPLLASCLVKQPEERPTASVLGKELERIGARAHQWQQAVPAALAEELAARERSLRGPADGPPAPWQAPVPAATAPGFGPPPTMAPPVAPSPAFVPPSAAPPVAPPVRKQLSNRVLVSGIVLVFLLSPLISRTMREVVPFALLLAPFVLLGFLIRRIVVRRRRQSGR
ncbi:serine/threonine-protein kinase [Streptomyces ochraceiscleroticus]|uniref:Serine/threonine-protein kinase n=1 Tax=Streptomyces ochraceiscleroticus TaxID=47761 RepID=A0ABW1MMK1_9ACTN|nr:serine/threonine-protein kinase [Streptomyces ochraceiscleroticus]